MSTLSNPIPATRLNRSPRTNPSAVTISAQPGTWNGQRAVYLRFAEGTKRVTYIIPLALWGSLNSDAIRTP
jgi:hypothetical protein